MVGARDHVVTIRDRSLVNRELSQVELEWLETYPIGISHGVTSGEYLAGCDDCDWTAQAESFEFLMTMVTTHLKETYETPTREQKVQKTAGFFAEFGWDPWGEGLIVDEEEPEIFDMLRVTEISGGEVVAETFYQRPLEDGGEPVGEWDSERGEG